MMRKEAANKKTGLFSKMGRSPVLKDKGSKTPVIQEEEPARTELQAYIDTNIAKMRSSVPSTVMPRTLSIKPTSSPMPARDSAYNTTLWKVPQDVWNRHILSRLSYLQTRTFSSTCSAAHQIVNSYINNKFTFSKFNIVSALKMASRDGVKLNFALLHRLCTVPFSYDLFYSLQHEENASWAIAAICGDICWLEKHHKDNLLRLTTKNSDSNKGIVFFLTIGDHLDIIKSKFTNVLKAYLKKPIYLQQLNYFAGKLGYFDICDFLELNYHVKPNQQFQKNECTIHWYAYYGKNEKLKIAIEKYPEIGNLLITQHGYLVHYAAEGGQIETVSILAEKFPSTFKEPLPKNNYTCVHIAARCGHSKLLAILIEEYKLDPCAISAFGNTPLQECSKTGTWDCFWILVNKYRHLPNFNEILSTVPHHAVGENHLDFLAQFVSRFGNNCIRAKSAYGDPLSFQLYNSKSMVTAKILVNDHGLDLTAKNKSGVTALLFIARMAIHYKVNALWIFTAELLAEFNSKFDNTLSQIPDNSGMTLESLIIQEEKQQLFSDTIFSKSHRNQ